MSDQLTIIHALINDFTNDNLTATFRSMFRNFRTMNTNIRIEGHSEFTKSIVVGEIVLDSGNVIVSSHFVGGDLTEKTSRKKQFDLAKTFLRSSQYQKFQAGIFVFYDSVGNFRISLVYAESSGDKRIWNSFRRSTHFVSKGLSNKTFISQLSSMDTSSLDGIKSAFSISAVTELFYKEFFAHFEEIVAHCKGPKRIQNNIIARDFATLFVIRIIFIGFLQKKRWLGEDEKFLESMFKEYKNHRNSKDNFYRNWLSPLLFQALNSPFGTSIETKGSSITTKFKKLLEETPFLNGGLFKVHAEIDDQGIEISDHVFEKFLTFIFSHAFTIEENSYQDDELQLNPEFLGIIFERLINKEDGAVYTPRTEVDFMCRISLVKWLAKQMDSVLTIQNLYELLFRESHSDDDQKFGSLSNNDAKLIQSLLSEVKVCDPAVGSGAFLVGMLNVICNLEVYLQDKFHLDNVDIYLKKQRIVRDNLYGVEVKEWAVWICQLRLWLSMFIDAPNELRTSSQAVLPSLDFKVCQGDSLVQGYFGNLIPIIDSINDPWKLSADLNSLLEQKKQYFSNANSKSKDEIEVLEREVALRIGEKNLAHKKKQLLEIDRKLEMSSQTLFGQNMKSASDKKLQQRRDELCKDVMQMEKQLHLIDQKKNFAWSVDFVEVFSGRGGFDIVIGNPPYISQEDIGDPLERGMSNSEYKKCLVDAVSMDFANYFVMNPRVNGRSDLYCYFYVRGIRILNPQGILAYICSNSWLDIGYGQWLKEFLVSETQVDLIIDNQAKKSFDSADVNTIISLIHRKKDKVEKKTKFVAMKRPLDQMIFSSQLIQIESVNEVYNSSLVRIFPVPNEHLLTPKISLDDFSVNQTDSKMIKWGAEFLRSPEIFLEIKRRPGTQLVPLHSVADILGYVHDNNTGERFPKVEFIGSVKELNRIRIKKNMKEISMFGVNSLGNSNLRAPILFSRTYGYEHLVVYNEAKIVGRRFYKIVPFQEERNLELVLFLNSTFAILQRELLGSNNLGGGGITFNSVDVESFLVPAKTLKFKGAYVEEFLDSPVQPILQELGFTTMNIEEIDDAIPLPRRSREKIDQVVFDHLHLTKEERIQIYRETAKLIIARKLRAEST